MRDITTLKDLPSRLVPRAPGCWIAATPEVRRRLLGLAIAVLSPALLPVDAEAQSSAGGTVRLIIRADALPRTEAAADSGTVAPDEPAAADGVVFQSRSRLSVGPLAPSLRRAGSWRLDRDAVADRPRRPAADEEIPPIRFDATVRTEPAEPGWEAIARRPESKRTADPRPD